MKSKRYVAGNEDLAKMVRLGQMIYEPGNLAMLRGLREYDKRIRKNKRRRDAKRNLRDGAVAVRGNG